MDERTEPIKTHAGYLASIEPHRRRGGYGVPGELVIAHGVRS